MYSPTILFVLTSHGRLGNTGRPTGYYVSDLAHAAAVFRDAGYGMDFLSVRGGDAPREEGVNLADPVVAGFLGDPGTAERLRATLAPRDVRPDEYAAVYFAGGHGTMWDFPYDEALAALTRGVYESGGIVAAVCHGSAALVNVTLGDGSHLVAGRRVACFTDAEEASIGLDEVVPFPLESTLAGLGALLSTAPDFQEHAVLDERLVTGQNPASATKVAQLVTAALRAQARPLER
ncbi:type 1 glutamine amidotransferase domain-containing protein [Streptomyces sp. E11-3]|uniref:type 1 glutamine amidotransferase domain-containing protein n=1 Tax=Streptomyces sp. E11-3 TaxID=3110112 RepID=UPI0039800C05